MSLTKNQEFSFWEVVESQIRSKSLRMGGHVLTKADTSRVANAYVLWALVVKDLLKDARLTSDRSLQAWVNSLAEQDLSDVMSVCKQTLACVRRWNSHMGVQGLDSFKHYLREAGVSPGCSILMPFWHTIYTFSVTFTLFQEINTFLSFITRLTLEDVDWIEKAAISTYIKEEESLKAQGYNLELINSLNELAKPLFAKYCVEGLPKHGNGATSTTPRHAGIDTKFQNFEMTWGLRQLEKYYGISHPLIPDGQVSGNDVTTRIMFVPKGIDKKRVISAEPIGNMYYQQLFFQSVDRMFQREPRWHVDLHNQEWNRQLALRGSDRLDYGTIDLSNASDSVTHSLVAGVMRGIPAYSHWERCRTRLGVLPDGSCITLEKYAPMGSAMCFPVECIIFSLVVQLASKNCHVNRYFRVYGDDIVVHADVFFETIRLLEELHFTVNKEKTFEPGSQFTESCGIECFQGADVSPVRIPRFYDPNYFWVENRRTSPGRVMGVMTFCNTLYSRGLVTARAYVIRNLLRYFPEVPFTSSGVMGLVSNSATNYHLEKRWSEAYQRYEYRTLLLVADEDTVDDNRRYQHLLERYSHTTRHQLFYPEDRIDVMAGDSHTRLKRCALPLDYF